MKARPITFCHSTSRPEGTSPPSISAPQFKRRIISALMPYRTLMERSNSLIGTELSDVYKDATHCTMPPTIQTESITRRASNDAGESLSLLTITSVARRGCAESFCGKTRLI